MRKLFIGLTLLASMSAIASTKNCQADYYRGRHLVFFDSHRGDNKESAILTGYNSNEYSLQDCIDLNLENVKNQTLRN